MVIEWDKFKIFKSDDDWEFNKAKLKDNIELLRSMLDTFYQDINSFKEFTLLKIAIDKSIEEVYCYPRRFIDIDINDEIHKKMFNEALEIYNGIVALSNKFEVLIKDNRRKIEEYLEDESFSYYKRYYEIVFKRFDHISEREDEYFSIYQSIRDEYQELLANKLNYNLVSIDGNDEVINEVNYSKYINHEDQSIRKNVYDALMNTYKEKQLDIFSLYIKKLRNDISDAESKKYTSLKQMKLEESELPDSLIDKTVSAVNKNLTVIHDYVALKKELSGLSEYHSYDVGYKKFTSDLKDIDYQEAFSLVYDSLAILGKEYLGYVDTLYNGGSIDLLPKKGKKTVSFTGITYAGIPYMCLNYKGGIDDLRTVAHEIGHATHLLFSKNSNNFEYFEFSLFITEVVAKVNERLFYRYFLDKTDNVQDKLMVLSNYISSLGNSLFSQVMLTEFEDKIINKLSNGEEIKVEYANELYEDLLRKYNGECYSVTENDKYGWLRINHYIIQEPFYLYQYSIGTALANIIYTKIINDQDYITKYIDFLKIGNKVNIMDSLKILDIDLEDETIFDGSIELMRNLITEYKILSKKA